ncbi:unnamed protein product [Rotaria magnacalcarata]|uniref:Uncharacterized protein n=1 Tax=Rotaria magnacalcarata TaxID=392030 RepID=A0A815VB43_9BILA|nr:unnamed protein product [Rotaria magnacalcarata]CAF2047323.1 unnamed protein product [Rotaria magnacalcarata]CAF2047917.1 unnamed protein product [Rotaria magnacalcarata]CAF3862390.1 unnamed protein product [Rotaria magnacalcarata]CAF4013648.1 unnamed protein product [Rotaria magnacalcarata]
MSYINQRKHGLHFPKIKRLNHHANRHCEKRIRNNHPAFNTFETASNYIKYFDYPLPDLLVDHSTDPLQNTARPYIDTSMNNSSEGRFKNHHMIVRRNGETTILRPKQDLVLVNGFTPVIRPSSILPSYQPIMSHSQVGTSLPIMNKMSIKKPEQTSIIKTKRNNRHQRNRSNEKFIEKNKFQHDNFSKNDFDHHITHESSFIHLVTQAIYEITQEKVSQPVPLMSILPEFPKSYSNYENQSFIPRFEEMPIIQPINHSSYANQQQYIPSLFSILTNRYDDSSCNVLPEQNRPLNSISLHHEHICFSSSTSHQQNYAHISDYLF